MRAIQKQDASQKIDITPSVYSAQLGWHYASNHSSDFKKNYGQYMTPVKVANFMSQLFKIKRDNIAILDPGAGAGILGCTVLEYLSKLNNPPKNIKFVAYEIDKDIILYLRQALDYSKKWLKKKNINLDYQIKPTDFILTNKNVFEGDTLFTLGDFLEKFDLIISNPPYFKLSKSDKRSKAASKIVHGQPNIYSIFMMISALLLNENGEMVFITPRSFAAGPYFKVFREHFFSVVRPTYIHLFGSRKDAFDKEAILQENIILKAIKDSRFKKSEANVHVSFSQGVKDLRKTIKRSIPLKDIINFESKNKVLRIPVTYKEDKIVKLVHSWKENLHSLGLNISTGPVVAFRASKYITDKDISNGHQYVPLLWMQNIKAMNLKWPVNSKKQQFIEDSNRTKKLLLQNKNYVLLRRFSAKEEEKRLIAAPLLSDFAKSEKVGLENHLNYIYRPKGNLTLEETLGLAALLNSDLLDKYFRTSNGNTQVSATELKDMPLPSSQMIVELGKYIIKNNFDDKQINALIQKNIANVL